jgi:hypothetical protein
LTVMFSAARTTADARSVMLPKAPRKGIFIGMSENVCRELNSTGEKRGEQDEQTAFCRVRLQNP